MDTPIARDPADEVAVGYQSGGTRIVAFLDPDLVDSPLRRALFGTPRPLSTPPAPATDPPGEPA
ncbi:hypothetical protein [Streptomyces sp. NPDC018059]|uniref:hypothetical protein n=1 Tax=Streptomyces sp. NPDC018059 TaxID=3365041 RepID=UPI0037B2F309